LEQLVVVVSQGEFLEYVDNEVTNLLRRAWLLIEQSFGANQQYPQLPLIMTGNVGRPRLDISKEVFFFGI